MMWCLWLLSVRVSVEMRAVSVCVQQQVASASKKGRKEVFLCSYIILISGY